MSFNKEKAMLNLEKIDSIMTKDVFTVEFDDTINKVDDIMKEENINQVPVLENGKLIGVITDKTLHEYELREIYQSDVPQDEIGYNKISDFRDLFAKNVHIIYPEDSIGKAIEIMTKKHADFLPVVDWDNNLKGIITTLDILLYVKTHLMS